MKGRPHVAVAEDPQLAEVGLLAPQPDGLGDALHDLVVRVGTLSLRVDGHGDDSRLQHTQLVEDGLNVTLTVGEAFPIAIETEPKMMDMVQGGASIGPNKLLFKFADLTFELLELGAVGFACLEVFYLRCEARFDIGDALQPPQPYRITKDAMAEATTHLVGVFAGHVVEIMMDVFLLLETVASLKEIGVKHHLDAALMQVIQGVFQGFLKEFIGDRVITRGHDGKVHLVGRRPQLPVDEGHET